MTGHMPSRTTWPLTCNFFNSIYPSCNQPDILSFLLWNTVGWLWNYPNQSIVELVKWFVWSALLVGLVQRAHCSRVVLRLALLKRAHSGHSTHNCEGTRARETWALLLARTLQCAPYKIWKWSSTRARSAFAFHTICSEEHVFKLTCFGQLCTRFVIINNFFLIFTNSWTTRSFESQNQMQSSCCYC